MSEKDTTKEEKESPFEHGQRESISPKSQGFWSRIEFDWPTIIAIAAITLTMIGIIAGLLQSAISDVNDDVKRLTERVNKIDDKIDQRTEKITERIDRKTGKLAEKMDAMTDDIAFIKGHIKNMSSSAKNNASQKIFSAKDNSDQPEKKIPLKLSIRRRQSPHQ